MKKFLGLALVLVALAVLAGCSLFPLTETWSYDFNVLGIEYAYCVEVSTSNADLKEALRESGVYEKEPCSLKNPVGSCKITEYQGYEDYDATWTMYFGSAYDQDAAELVCDLADGTWKD